MRNVSQAPQTSNSSVVGDSPTDYSHYFDLLMMHMSCSKTLLLIFGLQREHAEHPSFFFTIAQILVLDSSLPLSLLRFENQVGQ